MTELQAAVPPFRTDAESAYAELGKALAYIKQLSDLLRERAVEANALDDARIAAEDRASQLSERLNTALRDLEEAKRSRLRLVQQDPWSDDEDE